MEEIKKPRPTLGQLVIDEAGKIPQTQNASELADASLSDWDKIMLECYNLGRKGLPNRDFFIEILGKWERIYGSDRPKIRLYPFVRKSCPTPNYDHTVFKYNHKDDTIDYLWTLPDKDTYNWYLENANIVHPDRWELLKMILRDHEGDLLRQCKKLNGELIEEN